MSVFKDLPIKIQTEKFRSRRELFQQLEEKTKEGLPENVVKGVCKVLQLTLPRYNDNKSRYLVESYVKILVSEVKTAPKYLISSFETVAEENRGLVPSRSSSRLCLTVLSWSCIVSSSIFKDPALCSSEEVKRLIQTQSVLLMCIVGARCSLLSNKANKKFFQLWNENPSSITHYLEILETCEPAVNILIIWGTLVKYLTGSKSSVTITKHKKQFLELFTKIILGSKTKPSLFALEHSRYLLRQVSHDDFKELLLPALQKAMLRNPEVILQTVGHVLSGVTLDLSQYAMEIGKILATHLHSKEDLCREEAITACQNLASQCSSPQPVQDLIEHFFSILNGSGGKLTVAAQRLGVLGGIGALSHHTVSGSQPLSETAAELFISVLKQEVHEGTLIHALKMLALWCAKFTSQVPSSLVEWFKTGLGLKTTSLAVRVAYIKCMNAAFHGNTLLQALELSPILAKILEKGQAQPSQIPVATESLSAACLLMKLYSADVQAENKLRSVITALLDIDKQPFFSEKFLLTASEETLYSVIQLIERLILEHSQELVGKRSLVEKALLFLLTRPSLELRQHAHTTTRKLVSVLGEIELSRSLLKQFPSFVEQLKLQEEADKENKENDVGDGDDRSLRAVASHILEECLLTLCHETNLDISDREILGLESFLPSNLPVIVRSKPDLWEKLLKRLKLNPKSFTSKYVGQLSNSAIHVEAVTPMVQNGLKILIQLNPEVFVPVLVKQVTQLLQNPALIQVTQEEYNIYQTPEGELYKKSVIENLREDSVNNMKNIRKENKLYSYKEQMEELELRREIEAKKRARGEIKEPPLTKKQQEAKKVQLEKESQIRYKVKQLDNQFQKAVGLLIAGLEGNVRAFSIHLTSLVPVIIPLLQSNLCAASATEMYLLLSHAATKGKPGTREISQAYVTLRVLNPACQLDPAWLEEDLRNAVNRVVTYLHTVACGPRDKHTAFRRVHHTLEAPAFTYCFPLLRKTLLDQFTDPEVKIQVLEIISEYAQLRVKSDDEDEGHGYLNSPVYLPRREMLDVLIQVIGQTSGKVQQLSIKTLIDVAAAGSGLEGCAGASFDEVHSLLMGLTSAEPAVREAALSGLLVLVMVLPSTNTNYELGQEVTRRVWITKFDPEDSVKELAEKLWEEAKLHIDPMLCSKLLNDVSHPESVVRESAASALAHLMREYPEQLDVIVQELLNLYQENLSVPPPVMDNFGRLISEALPDTWEPRSGIAMTLCCLAPQLEKEMVSQLMMFFVGNGLGDRHELVRKNMLDAAVAIVDSHGKDMVTTLLPVFEEFLDQAPDSSSYDAVRQSVVILMGTLARHLDKFDPKVKPIVAKLIETLSTPSQQVQKAVADCLPPLVPAIKEDAPQLVHKLVHLLLESENYGERKGAAYGLAGLVKGLGILSLKQLDIMTTLTNAIQDKKNYRHREGALFAFEMLCNMLGRLFEPYIVHVLPHLLLCFGDGNQYVREATDETAKAVMSKLSAHGVKLVLPSLLAALAEDSWRTKAGSVELLGAMAFCAPKQLSSCLPNIVPKLIEVLSDSHLKVQKAGAQALQQIGSVIRNPEIQAIVPVLLDALQDPSKKTSTCLAILLDTKFVHFIDAPSLALIMPVVQRAFQDRSTETRKMAAQIIGNMYSLTDQKDLSPYLPTIIPGLKQSLLDPVPEVRSVSARALGAMVKGIGEASFEDLMPWLMETLTSESSSVDRSGAAQGLSEVMGGLGVEKLERLMPDIITTAERTDIAPHVKDGYIMMFIYLPMVFTREFSQYIGRIINPILWALADENEFVRDTALKAGQRIVSMYSDTAIEMLLPQLEQGLFDDNWRIRYSSVQLLGDLLYKISGVTGKMSTDTAGEDDNFGTEQSHKAILNALGVECRNRVLAGLYMERADVALMVRQAALHVWKVVVTNTPRTLREILPILFQLLLGCLASNSFDKRQATARTLGDLVRKLGERVLPEIIPILENGLDSDQSDQRQGVCIGLSEITASTSKDMVLTFFDNLVPTVRRALCDNLKEVRQAAAKTFDSLHSTVGVRALDDILPHLLKQLDDPEVGEYTLDGLRQVMSIKSKVVLPYLIPQLTAPPINTKALSFLSAVAGEALTKHLNKVLPALLSALSDALDTPKEQQETEYCQAVVLSVQDDLGVRTIIDYLLEAARNGSTSYRRAAVALLSIFCSNTKANYSTHVSQLLRGLIHLFTDNNPHVLNLSCEALNSVTKTLDTAGQLHHVADVRQAVRFAVSDLKGQHLLPGFCLPKGISPILPIFREAILNGQPEMKEQAAQGLGEVIKLTSPEGLKASVIQITGPLIRILGDRFAWNVKVAVLETLALLLEKVGIMLKPFLPQLQTTFLKALGDGNRQVRLRAAAALRHLIVIHTRCDPLFTELHNSVKNSDDSLRETMLHALRCVVVSAGDKMSNTIRQGVTSTVGGMLGYHHEVCRVTASGCLGALCKWLPEDELTVVVREHLLDDDTSQDWMLRHGRSIALMVALKEAPEKFIDFDWTERVTKTLVSYLTADRLQIADSGVRATGYFLHHLLATNSPIPQLLLVTFSKCMNHNINEVKQVVALTSTYLAKTREQLLPPQVLKLLVPHLVNGTKEKNTIVKANSEYALVAILKLRVGEDAQQECVRLLDPGAKDALVDVINKVLRKVSSQPEPKEEELDNTLLL
ncbi:lethal (3) 80Fj isoform X2 [Tachypleus tridentatus]